jgi:hypothetical protein
MSGTVVFSAIGPPTVLPHDPALQPAHGCHVPEGGELPVAWPGCWGIRLACSPTVVRLGKDSSGTTQPTVRLEWPMHLTVRAARIRAGFEPQAKRLVVQPSADDEHFLGIRVTLARTGLCRPRGGDWVSRVYSPATGSMLRVSSWAIPSSPLDWGPAPLALLNFSAQHNPPRLVSHLRLIEIVRKAGSDPMFRRSCLCPSWSASSRPG